MADSAPYSASRVVVPMEPSKPAVSRNRAGESWTDEGGEADSAGQPNSSLTATPQ